ncbi:MAG: thermostable hemolysin [Gammaproteobacteria bacterium]|nr:thermostable hemolysin [Gammaproteobacteria bacterium]
MTTSSFSSASPCIVEGVEPLLTELPQPISLNVLNADHPDRWRPEQFVRSVFKQCYDADIRAFYPTLLAFTLQAELLGVAGFRDGHGQALFSEQYLDQPLEQLIGAHWAEPVERGRIVEVGNLALANPGQARWVIAAVTMFLHAAGYRWVLFTAVKPLINAFGRLGLNPIALASADPTRLADDGQHWGSYYATNPLVCVGDIDAGYRKLVNSAGARQPLLQTLLDQVQRYAAASAQPLPTVFEGTA